VRPVSALVLLSDYAVGSITLGPLIVMGKFALRIFKLQLPGYDKLLRPYRSFFATDPSFVLPVSPSTVPLDRQAGQAINLSDVRDTPNGITFACCSRSERAKDQTRFVLL